MTLETFNFPYHTFETLNPESGFRAKFGNSYTFTTEPTSPDERVFKLNFDLMKFFVDENNNIDSSVSPEINMKRMIDFYHQHKLYKNFNYVHPVYGTLVVKFNKPLPEPRGIKGQNGVVEGFEVELLEVP